MLKKRIVNVLLVVFFVFAAVGFGASDAFCGEWKEGGALAEEVFTEIVGEEGLACEEPPEEEEQETPAEYAFSRVVLSDEVLSYTGSEQVKESVAVYGNVTANGETAEVLLTEGTDYLLVYTDNTNAGLATITITGLGVYADQSLLETFEITPAEISEVEPQAEAFVYTGSPIEPAVNVYALLNGERVLLNSDSEYTVQYSANIDAGNAEITVTGTGNFQGTLSRSFSIAPAPLTFATLPYRVMTYTGKPRTQTAGTVVWCGDKILENTVDYTISYANNIKIGTAEMTITGKGNYTGTLTETFAIKGKLEEAELKYKTLPYSGKARTQTNSLVVKGNANGKLTVLKKDTDYKVTYANNVNIGRATVTITGKGRYTGTLKRTFRITRAPLTSAKLKNWAMAYNGKPRTQTGSTTVRSGKMVLRNSVDYTIAYKDNVQIGTATMTITGKGNYAGTLVKTFAIKGRLISAELKYDSLRYSGKPRKQTGPTLVKGDFNGTGTVLTKGVDYRIRYENNTNVGTATMTITGRGNYMGTLTKTFQITPVALVDAVLPCASKFYTGKAIKPAPTVTARVGKELATLTKGTDYTVSYKKNKNPGTATVTVTGIGNFEGTLERTFTITRIKIGGSGTSRTLSFAPADKTYSDLKVAVWSHPNGPDDQKWYAMRKKANGIWTAKVEFVNFKGSGEASAHIYAGETFVCGIDFTINHADWLQAQSDRFQAEFLHGTNPYANIDYIQCGISLANNHYYGYDHTWRVNRHTLSCAGLVDLCLTHCGYGDFIKDDPPELIDGRRWGYLDLGTYSGKYNWVSIMTNEVGATWHPGLDGIQPGDVLYYDFDIFTNHTGFYLGNGVTLESRGPAVNFSYNDDSGIEIATFSNGLAVFPWQGYFRIPNKKKAW